MHWIEAASQPGTAHHMKFTAWSDGRFDLNARTVQCALGRGGVIDADAKREGDGATPLGVWPLLRVVYRPDRGQAPRTALPVEAIAPTDGWCDDPKDGAYNRPVTLPYPASCETMWRDDELYDVVVILAHNDDPPVAGMGSAIFLHCVKPGYPATEGCVALARADLLALLEIARPGDAIEVRRA
jgi:L,D-peptidoglycan transpeptidase YkuD (ErfK/YbiS/YcfS/YnhG family)